MTIQEAIDLVKTCGLNIEAGDTYTDCEKMILSALYFVKAYEEKEDRMLELPCKVGDIVYEIHSHRLIDECFVYGDCYECNANPCPIEGREKEKVYEIKQRNLETVGAVVNVIQDFGKTVFLTKEEAEKALEEMK